MNIPIDTFLVGYSHPFTHLQEISKSLRHLFSGYVNFIGQDFGLDGMEAARSDRYLQQAPPVELGKVMGKVRGNPL